MKKQQRFTTEKQITDKIDENRARMPVLLQQAIVLDNEAVEIFKSGKATMFEVARGKQCEARKLRKKVCRIEMSALPKLKNTLAAFNTEAMPFMPDKGVVLSK